MAILENSRHELFCQNMAKGMSTPEAYVAAGFSASAKTAHAYRLLAKDSIKQRIAELQTRNITKQDEMVAITTESLLAEAEEARLLAMREGRRLLRLARLQPRANWPASGLNAPSRLTSPATCHSTAMPSWLRSLASPGKRLLS